MHLVHVLLELFEYLFLLFCERSIEFFLVPRHELEQLLELLISACALLERSDVAVP